MIKRSPSDDGVEVEYYLLDGEQLARVRFDRHAEEYFYGEVMDEFGDWHECPANDILIDGDEISEARALERVREMGGTLHEHE